MTVTQSDGESREDQKMTEYFTISRTMEVPGGKSKVCATHVHETVSSDSTLMIHQKVIILKNFESSLLGLLAHCNQHPQHGYLQVTLHSKSHIPKFSKQVGRRLAEFGCVVKAQLRHAQSSETISD